MSITHFFGDYYDNSSERIAKIGDIEIRYKMNQYPLGNIEFKKGENMTIIGAGRYVFGKNVPEGMFDLNWIEGRGYLHIYYIAKNKSHEFLYIGEKDAKGYMGLDSEEVKYFVLEGNLKVEISKAKMIEIE